MVFVSYSVRPRRRIHLKEGEDDKQQPSLGGQVEVDCHYLAADQCIFG